MVNDAGNIIRVKRVRGWITLVVALPLLAAALVAGGYLRSDSLPHRDRRSTAEVERLQEKLRVPGEENSRSAAMQSTSSGKDGQPATARSEAPPVATAHDLSTRPPEPADPGGPAAGDDVKPAPSRFESQAQPPAYAGVEKAPVEDPLIASSGSDEEFLPPVGLKDLTLDYNSDRSAVSVSFKIFNRRADGETLFGFAFVILKADEQSPGQWMVFPESDLTAQGPVSFRRGYDFSISNYMVIRFNPRPLPAGMVIKLATIQVYDASGRLLLERDFRLN
jgi:hypothetical protein